MELGVLELIDDNYTFGHGRGRAKKYRLSQSISLNVNRTDSVNHPRPPQVPPGLILSRRVVCEHLL